MFNIEGFPDDTVFTFDLSVENLQFCEGEKVYNFRLSEFACKDGSPIVFIQAGLIRGLQRIRDAYGLPLNINSAYRTPEHNAKVGGAKNSYHIKGMAADIRISNYTTDFDVMQLAATAEKQGLTGIGVYKGFVHVDTRESKTLFVGSGVPSHIMKNNQIVKGA